MPIELTSDELRNGWTAHDVQAYRAQRDEAVDRVGGNVVTEYRRPPKARTIENARTFDPHDWGSR